MTVHDPGRRRSTILPVAKTLRLVLLSAVIVFVAAQPAAAGPGQRYWFYWAAPLILLSAILLCVALGIGYYVRVVRPKYRGR